MLPALHVSSLRIGAGGCWNAGINNNAGILEYWNTGMNQNAGMLECWHAGIVRQKDLKNDGMQHE